MKLEHEYKPKTDAISPDQSCVSEHVLRGVLGEGKVGAVGISFT